jgi:hypothetical protein
MYPHLVTTKYAWNCLVRHHYTAEKLGRREFLPFGWSTDHSWYDALDRPPEALGLRRQSVKLRLFGLLDKHTGRGEHRERRVLTEPQESIRVGQEAKFFHG